MKQMVQEVLLMAVKEFIGGLGIAAMVGGVGGFLLVGREEYKIFNSPRVELRLEQIARSHQASYYLEALKSTYECGYKCGSEAPELIQSIDSANQTIKTELHYLEHTSEVVEFRALNDLYLNLMLGFAGVTFAGCLMKYFTRKKNDP